MRPDNEIHVGIEIIFLANDEKKIHFILQDPNSKEMGICKEYSLVNIHEINLHIPKESNIYLSLSGTGIRHQWIREGENDEITLDIEENLYIQTHQCLDGVIKSYIRKERLEQIKNAFKDSDHNIVFIQLGPFCIENLHQKFPKNKPNSNEIQYETRFHSITIDNGKIKNYNYRNADNYTQEIEIGSMTIPSSLLTAYALLENKKFTKSEFTDISENNIIQNETEIIRRKKHIKITKKYALLIAALLMSDYYFNYVADQIYTNEKKTILLNDTIKRNSEKVQNNKQTSFLKYTQDIYSMEESDIKITQYILDPISKKFSVEGLCKDLEEIQEWTNELKRNDKTKNTNIDKYSYNKNSNTSSFLIKGLLK